MISAIFPLTFEEQRAKEIRIHVLGEWRIIYVAKFEDAVYVLHSFQKKSRKTSLHDVELARKRYKEAVRSRTASR